MHGILGTVRARRSKKERQIPQYQNDTKLGSGRILYLAHKRNKGYRKLYTNKLGFSVYRWSRTRLGARSRLEIQRVLCGPNLAQYYNSFSRLCKVLGARGSKFSILVLLEASKIEGKFAQISPWFVKKKTNVGVSEASL
jgi:hypothetical protein